MNNWTLSEQSRDSKDVLRNFRWKLSSIWASSSRLKIEQAADWHTLACYYGFFADCWIKIEKHCQRLNVTRYKLAVWAWSTDTPKLPRTNFSKTNSANYTFVVTKLSSPVCLFFTHELESLSSTREKSNSSNCSLCAERPQIDFYHFSKWPDDELVSIVSVNKTTP